jgi:hypothetical protein
MPAAWPAARKPRVVAARHIPASLRTLASRFKTHGRHSLFTIPSRCRQYLKEKSESRGKERSREGVKQRKKKKLERRQELRVLAAWKLRVVAAVRTEVLWAGQLRCPGSFAVVSEDLKFGDTINADTKMSLLFHDYAKPRTSATPLGGNSAAPTSSIAGRN